MHALYLAKGKAHSKNALLKKGGKSLLNGVYDCHHAFYYFMLQRSTATYRGAKRIFRYPYNPAIFFSMNY